MARSSRLTVIADTGAIYALIDASDAWHERVVEWWEGNRATVILPTAILAEVAYLLQTRIGPAAEAGFFQSVVDEEFTVESTDDYSRILALIREYDDFPLGYVDASIIATAESFETRTILTTDRRHFAAIRPRNSRSLELVP